LKPILTAVKLEHTGYAEVNGSMLLPGMMVLKGTIEIMNRLCIYPKDIQVITGRSDRYGKNLIKKIKEHFNKQQHQFVTVQESWQYMGLQL